jgi:TM2 domain-containing membrane protein YozV
MRLAVLTALALLCTEARADDQPAPQTTADTTPPTAAPRADATAAPDPACADREITPRLTGLLRAKRYADTHHAVVGLRVLCGDATERAWRLADDIALLRLEDRGIALTDLKLLADAGDAPAMTVLAWAYVQNRDTSAAKLALARLPAPRQAALRALGNLDDEEDFASHARQLPAPLSQQALALGSDYYEARAKSPAAAGIMSALIPGAGQIYAGSFEAAAVTFALNALFIGATIELALEKHYATAAAAGTAASFFYVGGIVNAVDLARRRNEVAQRPYADALEELLVPELSGSP